MNTAVFGGPGVSRLSPLPAFTARWGIPASQQDALMDQGGNFPLLFGVGADGIGGTADDPDVDFGPDALQPGEGFSGLENTAARTRWGLSH